MSARPDLQGAAFRILAEGWHSTALEVDGRWVFKFPKSWAAETALLKEAAVLAAIRSRISMPVPEMRLHREPRIFSCHEKLHGEPLLANDYQRLPESARQHLGEALGRFYAELHGLDASFMEAAGAGSIDAWQSPAQIRARAFPKLDGRLRKFGEAVVSAFERLSPDLHGTTYGFFDGHGWNMAFDHDRRTLNGIYDFADSGFGPLHQDFIYSNFISSDLTERTVSAYEDLTGRTLDRGRIALLTGFHRLSELAALADDPQHVESMVAHVAAWAAKQA